MKIRIFNGFWGRTYKHTKDLKELGFTFVKKKNSCYWEKELNVKNTRKNEDIIIDQKILKIKNYCKKHNLKMWTIQPEQERSGSYRKQFLKTQKHKWTFCAYCGKPIRLDKATVDHIIPVQKVRDTKKGRNLLKTLKIKNVNDNRNLVAACETCNGRKGSKMGIWIVKGLVGKNHILWILRWILRGVLILSGISLFEIYFLKNLSYKC